MRKVAGVIIAALSGMPAFSSCASPRTVSIELTDACLEEGKSFQAAAQFVQMAVFPAGCPSHDELAAGDTRNARITWTAPIGGRLPPVGDLPQSKFGFAAILRNVDCAVVGYGCTTADLEDIGVVNVVVCDWSNRETPAPRCGCSLLKGGGCFPPTTCQAGSCRPPTKPDPGGCSLALRAAGALPAPIAGTSRVAGPAIVATDHGFMLGYRASDGSDLHAVLAHLRDDGGVYPASPVKLGSCAGAALDDGVGIAFAHGSGMLTTSIPDCGGKGAGSGLIPFSSTGQVETAAIPVSAEFESLRVAQAGALAPARTKGEWEVVYGVKPKSGTPRVERYLLQGPTFKSKQPALPFDQQNAPFLMVATSSQVRVFLAPIQSDGGATTVVRADSGSSEMLSPSAEFSIPSAAPWAALAAWGNRVVAGVPAGTGMAIHPAVYQDGLIIPKAAIHAGSGSIAGGAVAVLRDHVIVVQGTAGRITAIRLDGADGNLAMSAAASTLPSAVGPVNLGAFDGSRVAVAAARESVAIAWLTRVETVAGSPVGGWALLGCAQQ